MAGDWLKVCKDTPDKPEILAIAARLNCHPDVAFARCFKLWSWFDSHTTDGVTYSVTKVTLDALLHRDGLCDALVTVGWLIERDDGGLQLPNFGYHNGETAKARAMSAKRQEKHRNNRNKNNADGVTNVTVDALPREEKRREEKDIPPNPQGGGAGRATRTKDETPYHEIRQAYCDALPGLPQPTDAASWAENRKRTVRARWNESKDRQDVQWWREYFEYVARSAFLTGNTPQNFEASFDWLINPTNMQKVCEGNYHKVLNHG